MDHGRGVSALVSLRELSQLLDGVAIVEGPGLVELVPELVLLPHLLLELERLLQLVTDLLWSQLLKLLVRPEVLERHLDRSAELAGDGLHGQLRIE